MVVVWPGTNSVVKEMPANGFSYTGNASHGLGSSLPATGYFVVHAGAGNQVTVNNLAANTRYNVAVFSYNLVSHGQRPDGRGTETRWNVTAVYKREGGRWRITHHHFSFTRPELKEPRLE